MKGVSNYPSNKQMSAQETATPRSHVEMAHSPDAVHPLLYSRGSNLGGFSAAMMVSVGGGDAG